MPRIVIALVVDVAQRVLGRVRLEPCARQGEERPQPDSSVVAARRRHRGEPPGAGAAQQLQQQRLGLIVRVMRKQQRGDALLVRELHERGITGCACLRFEARTRHTWHVHVPPGKRHATLVAGRAADLGPRVGVGRKAVMHVQRDDIAARGGCDRAGRVEQHHGITPAGERDADAPAGGESVCERVRHGGAYVVGVAAPTALSRRESP